MKKRNLVVIVLICVVVLCLLLFAAFLLFRNLTPTYSPPLVLIHRPNNHDQVPVGEGFIVHITADDPDGLAALEFWADNELIDIREVESDEPVEKIVLSSAWTPLLAGEHLLIASATTVDGDSGQASIMIEAVEQADDGISLYTVQPGDSLQSIAEDQNFTEEEILEMNDGLDPSSLEAGDDLILPEGAGGPSIPPEPSPADPGDDLPPEGVDDPPGGEEAPPEAMFHVEPVLLDFFNLLPVDMPEQLKLEVLSLETRSSYEMLHCYAILAGVEPRWIPDVDGDQSTDETFTSTGGAGTAWNVAEHFARENAFTFSWPISDPVPLDLSCVGVLAGGLESEELGRIVDSVEPERWGILQNANSAGGESTFRMTYKISHADTGLDVGIDRPWNARINQEAHTLEWDYLSEERDNIDGFAILLNDTYQWTEYRSAHDTDIPVEWFNLPCGDEYRFQVIAFRTAFPEGDYSLPSNTAFIHGGEVGNPECGRTVVVTFETLTTGVLGGNPRPVYGSFYANEQALTFDGRPGEGGSPASFGITQNSEYNISRIMGGYGSDASQLIVELPLDSPSVQVGFDIYKGSSTVCSGWVTIPDRLLAGTYSGTIDTNSPMDRWPDSCIVNFSLNTVGETPVVEPGAPPPLPDLFVQKLSVEPTSGQLRIHIRNGGQATWSNKDIIARVSWPGGGEIGDFVWPNVTLAPGETQILSQDALDPQPALGVCVLLDPENVVEETRDRLEDSGVLGEKQPYCRPLPDLSITNVSYEGESNDIRIHVQNNGEAPLSSADTGGSLDHANLLVRINLEDGEPLNQHYPDLDLGYRESTILVWPLTEAERDRMRDGYTVILNPEGSIAELDGHRNDYEVKGVSRLRISWRYGKATFCPVGILVYGESPVRNTWDMHLTATVRSGRSVRTVADWNSPEFELTWSYEHGNGWCGEYLSDWFEVSGDEVLIVSTRAGLDIFAYGYRWFTAGEEGLTAANGFGGTHHVPPGTDVEISVPEIESLGECNFWVYGWSGDDGLHQIGPCQAVSEDITGYCDWETIYKIFRED